MNKPRPIVDIATGAGIDSDSLIPYGHSVAKVPLRSSPGPAPLVMVTAITPTPLGEGKTTTAVGLVQGLARLGRRPIATLRQPSLGPTFGIKGGAAGAGQSQIIPSELLNLHLTGDFHAITAAHNLLAAMVDNHLHHGNELGIDPHSITWPRVLDVNDRALRNIVIGLGRKIDGVPRQGSFDITAASELMTIVALASSQADLRARLGRIVIGYTHSGAPVTAEKLAAAGAMAAILHDALLPNLMQTTEGVPVLVHTGAFGNISIGNSSVVADLAASNLGDIVVTESGFGADLGAERMVNLKSRVSGYEPSVAVMVVTVRSMKAFSGAHRIAPGKPLPEAMLEENPGEVAAGLENLAHHLRIVEQWGIPTVVASYAFPQAHE
ncbi:MAG: formate--tetrahydrofolate ligase, partial [Ruaniaceae bacterium]|nr:formate--tetrahydrofolate ligase [Ruaniaceae bacterium]